ncbi:hypothetical protein BCR32DRAFT_264825 [Anaeromyces robustus]|uniref:F-box domain-containing protein n=1 Tax=Anaeromyces robustus TaxID=1754192 RepID=A0A1Y1XLP2_9FUNG|nr:hypothetical protein BCR32DRAFT_264825 [Anaeromyces robustus]|eukprot:ORX86670.1 hypothetical protein BCR32DRAFT_264825 [Anaeromyces robustus]
MNIHISNKNEEENSVEFPKSCWNIKSLNHQDASISSIIIPTTDNRQNNNDFPSLKEASSRLNKKNVTKYNKIILPFLRRKSKKNLPNDIHVLQINNLHLNYQEYYSPTKKDFKFSKVIPKSIIKGDNDLNKALVPYSPYANYYCMFMPPPYASLYHYWWKIPKCGFDIINGKYSNDYRCQLLNLINIINGKNTILNNNSYNDEEINNMINILQTLNLRFSNINQCNSSLYVNSTTLSSIKIKDISPPSSKKNRVRTKSKLVKLESIIPKKELEVQSNEVTHLEDIFKAFKDIKVTNGPSGKYTVLMHLLFFLTPRELCLMTRVCKSWKRELLNSKYSVDLWWNIWMNHVWIGKAQREKVDYNKYLEQSRSINGLSNISLPSSRESLASSLSSLSLNHSGSNSSLEISKASRKLKFPWYHTITRAERKRGTKVWIERAVEVYRKTEVRGLELFNYSSSSEEESSSESESEDENPKYVRPEGRGRLTAEEKNNSRTQYKLMGSKPKTKRPWTREKGLSKEWLFHNDLL